MIMNWRAPLMRALPHNCFLCTRLAGAELLCGACRADLPRLPVTRCPRCAAFSSTGETCGACLRKPPAYEATIAAYAYRFPVDSLVQEYKYGRRLALAGWFAEALIEATRRLPRPDRIVAMPLSAARLRERGFNQALEIARGVGRALRVSVAMELCSKIRETQPQVELPWERRAANVRGAFACNERLDAERVAIVDDVMTTGASLNELSRVLKRAGAASVQAWVVARALPR